MKKPKVCIITTVHFHYDVRIFYKEAVSLVESGYDVTLIAPSDKNEVLNGITIVPLKKQSNRLQRVLVSGWQAFKKACQEKADLYHFHDPEFIPYALLLRVGGKRVIYDIHEDYKLAIAQKEYLPVFLRKILATLFAGLEVFFSRPFKIVIAEKYYQRRFPHSTAVLNYPRKELFTFPLTSSKEEGPIRLIYTGDISADRGPFIHAGLVNLICDSEVYMIGSCSEKMAKKLYELAGTNRERLQIEGIDRYVPFEEIMEFYRQGGWTAGLALFPPSEHYYEKELTKFFEYMGSGIPLLCSNFPAWQALVTENGCGLSVDPLNPEEIAEAIRYLHEEQSVAEEMGKRGRAAVQERYNWSFEKEKMLALYKDMLK